MTYHPPRKVRRERDRHIQKMQKAGWSLNPTYDKSEFEEVFVFISEQTAQEYGFRKSGIVKMGKGAQQAFAPGLFPRRFATPEGVEEIPPFIRP